TGRLFTDAETNRIRFVPTAGFRGTSNFIYRAWDRTIGTNGGVGDATVRGGAAPYSGQPANATIKVSRAISRARSRITPRRSYRLAIGRFPSSRRARPGPVNRRPGS